MRFPGGFAGSRVYVRLAGFVLVGLVLVAAVRGVPAAENAAAPHTENPVPFSAGELAPSQVIFPQQRIPLRFFYDKHLKGMACAYCHDQVRTSTNASDDNLPRLKGDAAKHDIRCAMCHKIFAPDAATRFPPATCTTCHPTSGKATVSVNFKDAPPERMLLPPPNLNFPHKKHLDNGILCQQCHGDFKKVQLATRDNLPRMEVCLQCHNGTTTINGLRPPAACATCHLTEANGLLRLRFPTGVLKPGPRRTFFHDENWVKNHRPQAEADRALCRNCHLEDWCSKCHQAGYTARGGGEKPAKIHPNDWIATHPKTAFTNRFNCSSCHRLESFCRSCHEQHRVTLDTFPLTRLFHPPDWVTFGFVTAEHHRNYARKNIQACAACHREDDCLQCHSTSTVNIRPHPRGFDGSSIRKRNTKACLKCHDRSDPLLRR
ncbi:MAG: cytochrome c3 family protein [Candidatus Tectomicrobia bacterium]|nr:cytochrome c3 family protein [Candidatus Tectomicrobia bacterium]